jgi:CheY-like chemotaxis protein
MQLIDPLRVQPSISQRQRQKSKLDFTNDVIVIDDDQDDRQLIGHMFHKIDKQQSLRYFKNGEEFLNHLQYQDYFWNDSKALGLPKLVFVDMQMPITGGIETIKAIRGSAHWRDVPVILTTGSRDDVKIEQAYELGANAFLSKPFSQIDLMQAMSHGFNYASTLI